MPEEYTNEDDVNAVTIHSSLHETSGHSTVLLPGADFQKASIVKYHYQTGNSDSKHAKYLQIILSLSYQL